MGQEVQGQEVQGEVLKLKDNILNHLVKSLNDFINELDIAFEYIGNKNISKIKKYIKKIDKDQDILNDFVNSTLSMLKPYTETIIKLSGDKKAKAQEFLFLNYIQLFKYKNGDDIFYILDFAIFKDENRNTKKSIIRHLNKIYMGCFSYSILVFPDIQGMTDISQNMQENLQNMLQNMMPNMAQNMMPNMAQTMPMPNMAEIMPQLQNFNPESLINSMLSNSSLTNLVEELSNDIQEKNIDPMSLVSSIFSGSNDPTVSNIFDKIQRKLISGEIDVTQMMSSFNLN